MRQIILDTETTGLEPEQGHRIIEIGCIEVVNRRRTGRVFHRYLSPEREIDPGALLVHGLTAEFLAGQPRFAEIAVELMEFLRGAELVIHNAPFDVAFLDAELGRLPEAPGRIGEHCMVLDTLQMARQMHPGQRNGLDALCKRYSVDNSHRDLHGALLDADLLLEVYLAMTGGQGALTLGEGEETAATRATIKRAKRPRGSLVVRKADAVELAHTSSGSRRSTRRAAAGRCGVRSSRTAGSPRDGHAVAGICPQLPGARARLVQAHDRRVPGPEPAADDPFRPGRHRLGAAGAVHIHAGDGAALLPAAAGWAARASSRC